MRTIAAVVAAVLAALIAFSPTLLGGTAPSAFGLVATGAILLVVGLLARRAVGAEARTFGTLLAIIGGVTLALAIGLVALLLSGGGRPY